MSTLFECYVINSKNCVIANFFIDIRVTLTFILLLKHTSKTEVMLMQGTDN